jgi:hypothetical protein
MKKIFRLFSIGLLGVVLIVAVVKTVLLYFTVDELKTYASLDRIKGLFNKPTQKQNLPQQTKIPNLELLMAQASVQEAVTPAQIEEEKQVTNQQIALVKKYLSSTDVNSRYFAAQQLSAYPTPESEALLLKTFADKNPAVRKAAVESLFYFEALSNPAINALLTVINDNNPEIQASAITTLQTQISNEQAGSERYQMIMQGLQQAESSPNLSPEIREVLHEFVEEQHSIVGVNPLPPQNTETADVIE